VVSGEYFRWVRKTMMWAWQVDPSCQRVREKGAYRFGIGFLGRGPDLELGQIVFPNPFSCFFLLFFFSSFSFSDFLFPV
jgi:hypothetical protein